MRLRIEYRGRGTLSVAGTLTILVSQRCRRFPVSSVATGLRAILDALRAFDETGGPITQLSLEHLAKRISR
jgi:hypothetical protein